MPLIPATRRQRQEGFSEFEASMVYRTSTRTAWATQRNRASKTKNNGQKSQTPKQKQRA